MPNALDFALGRAIKYGQTVGSVQYFDDKEDAEFLKNRSIRKIRQKALT